MSDAGLLTIDRRVFENLTFKDEPFGKVEAYLWIGVYGPVPAKYSWLARRWRWQATKCRKFIYRLAGAGLIIIHDEKLTAVELCKATPVFIERSWTALRAFIFARDGYTCVYCGSRADLHCDHVLARSKGGGSQPENLVTACASCNLSKGGKTLEEWRS